MCDCCGFVSLRSRCVLGATVRGCDFRGLCILVGLQWHAGVGPSCLPSGLPAVAFFLSVPCHHFSA